MLAALDYHDARAKAKNASISIDFLEGLKAFKWLLDDSQFAKDSGGHVQRIVGLNGLCIYIHLYIGVHLQFTVWYIQLTMCMYIHILI